VEKVPAIQLVEIVSPLEKEFAMMEILAPPTRVLLSKVLPIAATLPSPALEILLAQGNSVSTSTIPLFASPIPLPASIVQATLLVVSVFVTTKLDCAVTRPPPALILPTLPARDSSAILFQDNVFKTMEFNVLKTIPLVVESTEGVCCKMEIQFASMIQNAQPTTILVS
jgi:hypothetical protein